MLTQQEQLDWAERDRVGVERVNQLYTDGKLTDSEIVTFLMRHGDAAVPCSRYGYDTESCARFVAAVADPWLEVCDGDAAGALESIMSAAVNNSDDLAEFTDHYEV